MVRIQYISIAVSTLLIIFIVLLIRNKKIKEEYSILWLLSSVIFLVLSLWKRSIDILSNIVGIDYAPVSILLIMLLVLYMISIHFSLIISKFSEKNKNLIQEVGLLRFEIQQIDEKLNKGKRKK